MSVPGFKVQLKAGLHSGWVIEGAVGSSHKIDASYLSPHVNMTARIETATFQARNTLLQLYIRTCHDVEL